MITTTVKVTYCTGAYNCQIGDKRASSTLSEKEAVSRAATKAFGDLVQKVEPVGRPASHLESRWRITLSEPVIQN